MQQRRGPGIFLLLSVLFLLPTGILGVVIKEASSSSARNNAIKVKLMETATGSLAGWSFTDAMTRPKWLRINRSIGSLGPTTILQNLHGPSFSTLKSSAESTILDSWLLHGRSSVQQLVRHLAGMPLPRLALLQTMRGRSTASVSITEPGPDIIVTGGSPNERLKEELEEQSLALFTILISSVVTVVLAFFYWRHRKAPERQLDAVLDEGSFKAWRFGLFSCFSDPEICLWACCCPAIRWADTLRYMCLLGFWIAFAIYFGIEVVLSTSGGNLIIWAVLAIVCATMRQEMRIAYGMSEQGGWTYLEDFCLYCCCACCTIIQEARQVEEAYKVGYPIEVRPSWDQGAVPSSAHVQGVPAHHAPGARMQEGNGNAQP